MKDYLLWNQIRRTRSVCLVFPPPISHKKWYCFPNLRKYQKHEIKTTIGICKVRLPVLINPASWFSNRSFVRFPPECLWVKQAFLAVFFIFWYLWKTNAFKVNHFYNDCACCFHHGTGSMHVLGKDGVSIGCLFFIYFLLVWTFYSLLFMITIWTSAGKLLPFRKWYAFWYCRPGQW